MDVHEFTWPVVGLWDAYAEDQHTREVRDSVFRARVRVRNWGLLERSARDPSCAGCVEENAEADQEER